LYSNNEFVQQRRLHEGLASNAKQLSELKSEKERAEASAAQLPQLQRDQEARLQSIQVALSFILSYLYLISHVLIVLKASLTADLEVARTQAATLQKQLDDNRAALSEARDEGSASADEVCALCLIRMFFFFECV
jgi:DNA repair exonuclease SbcCD ATPase subunit